MITPAYGPEHPVRIVNCHQTCWARPSQWECFTEDGFRAYLRDRDWVSVGIGITEDDAVDNTIYEAESEGWNSTLEEFAAQMPEWIEIATPQVSSDYDPAAIEE